MEDDAVLFVQCTNEIAHLGPKHTLHRPLLGRHDMDLDTPRAQRRRGLETDKARADHDRAARTVHRGDNRPAIRQRTQRMDMRLVGSRNRQPHRLGPRRQQKTVIGNRDTVGDDDIARFGVDRGDIAVKPEFDAGIPVKAVRPQRQPVFRRAAGEIVLGQIWPVDRRRGIIAEHDDAAAKLLPPECLGRGKSRRAPADDHDPAGRIDGPPDPRLRLLALSPDEDALTLVLDMPDGERAQCRCARSFTATQIETGVMPRAADTFADHQPLGERPVIMSAMCIDRENLGSGAHQQDILIADVAEQGFGGEVRQDDTLGKIWPGGRSLLFSHIVSPNVPAARTLYQVAVPRNSRRISSSSRKNSPRKPSWR